jgi:hypothetical protein
MSGYYKEPSIISGTGAAIWSKKLTLGLLATITLEVVPFGAYVQFLVLLAFLNAARKSCSVRAFSTACRVDGDDSHVVFGQKFPGEKGSKRRCVVVMQQPVLLLPKFWAKSSHIFKQLR